MDETKQGDRWTAYRSTPGMGSIGYGFIREAANHGPLKGYLSGRVFGMDTYDGPNGNALQLAQYLNDLERKLDVVVKALRYLKEYCEARPECLNGVAVAADALRSIEQPVGGDGE